MSVLAPERVVTGFPEGEALVRQVGGRNRRAGLLRNLFLLALILAVVALLTLLYTIINQTFGLVAVQSHVSPDELTAEQGLPPETDLSTLSKEQLVAILEGRLEQNVGRRLEREQRFFEDRLVFESQAKWDEVCARAEPPTGCSAPVRDAGSVYAIVVKEIVQPNVLTTWSLTDSLLWREAVEAQVAAEFPEADLEFRSWVSGRFLASPQDPTPEVAGIRTAIFGSLWVLAVTVIFAFPVGVAAAVYLEEYATDNRINRLIRTNINNLAGVPSIIYGMLGLAVFVRTLNRITSGAAFGVAGAGGGVANGRTILAAGLTLALLVLPVVIISSQEAIRAVPVSMRRAGLALGATKWQTIRAHVLPNAIPGILTGTILAVARAFGETAPLVVVGASTFITTDPSGPFSKFTVLPIQIYQWTARPQLEFRNIAAAAILVLLVLLLSLNAAAIVLRNRYQRKFS